MIDIQIHSDPLDPKLSYASVADPGVGGIVQFVGTVRNQTKGKKVLRLDFEAYEPMAIKEMTKICLLYTSPSPRDRTRSRMPSSA